MHVYLGVVSQPLSEDQWPQESPGDRPAKQDGCALEADLIDLALNRRIERESEVRHHVDGCPYCSRALAGYQAKADLFDESLDVAAPLPAPRPLRHLRRRRRCRLAVQVIGLAAAVLVVLTALLCWRDSQHAPDAQRVEAERALEQNRTWQFHGAAHDRPLLPWKRDPAGEGPFRWAFSSPGKLDAGGTWVQDKGTGFLECPAVTASHWIMTAKVRFIPLSNDSEMGLYFNALTMPEAGATYVTFDALAISYRPEDVKDHSGQEKKQGKPGAARFITGLWRLPETGQISRGSFIPVQDFDPRDGWHRLTLEVTPKTASASIDQLGPINIDRSKLREKIQEKLETAASTHPRLNDYRPDVRARASVGIYLQRGRLILEEAKITPLPDPGADR